MMCPSEHLFIYLFPFMVAKVRTQPRKNTFFLFFFNQDGPVASKMRVAVLFCGAIVLVGQQLRCTRRQ